MPDNRRLPCPADRAAALSAALRLPLADLFSRIEAIQHGAVALDRTLREPLEAILLDGYRVLRLASSIALTEGDPELSPAPTGAFSLWELLTHCFSTVALLTARGPVAVEYAFPAESIYVLGEEDAVVTALLHLTANAVEASPDGGVVTVRGSMAGGRAVITVEDEGRGIPPEVLPHVFEPYYSCSGDGLPYQSAGLGLPLARAVMERLGGSVRILPRESGTSVICSLPVLTEPGEVPLRAPVPDYREDRFSPVYTVLCCIVPPPWPYE